MPDAWCSEADAEKRARCGVPRDVAFQTEPALALEMVKGVAERGQLPFQWVAADEHYGMNPTFLDGVAGLGKCSFAEVPKTTYVWPEEVKIIPPGQGPRGAPYPGLRVASGLGRLIKPRGENSTPGTLKGVPVILIKPVAYLKY